MHKNAAWFEKLNSKWITYVIFQNAEKSKQNMQTWIYVVQAVC